MVYGAYSRRGAAARKIKRTRRRVAGRRRRTIKRLSERVHRLASACNPTLQLPEATLGSPYNFNMTHILVDQVPSVVPFHDMTGGFQLPMDTADGHPIALCQVAQQDEIGRDDLCITPLRHRFLFNLEWERKWDTADSNAPTAYHGNVPIPMRVELWIVKADSNRELFIHDDEKTAWLGDTPYADLYRAHPSGQFLPDNGGTAFAERGMMLDLFARALRQRLPDPYMYNTEASGLVREQVKFIKRKVWRNVLPYGWTRRNFDMWNHASQTAIASATAGGTWAPQDYMWPPKKHREFTYKFRCKQKEMKFTKGGVFPQGKFAQYYAFVCAAPEVDFQGGVASAPANTVFENSQAGRSHGCLPTMNVYHSFEFKQ